MRSKLCQRAQTDLRERGNFPRLTVRGLIIHSSNDVASGQNRKFDWCDAMVDATIVSALTFFSTLGGGSVAGLNALSAVQASVVAAAAQFFMFLALKRGIVKRKRD